MPFIIRSPIMSKVLDLSESEQFIDETYPVLITFKYTIPAGVFAVVHTFDEHEKTGSFAKKISK